MGDLPLLVPFPELWDTGSKEQEHLKNILYRATEDGETEKCRLVKLDRLQTANG